MEELINKVIQWANDRNLIKGSDAKTQCLKLVSEFGELGGSIFDRKDQKDDIGDCLVVCIILSEIGGHEITKTFPYAHTPLSGKGNYMKAGSTLGKLTDRIAKGQDYQELLTQFVSHMYAMSYGSGVSAYDSLLHAYEEIKDRKGVMISGIFIKESDERYESAVREIRGEV